MNFQLLTPLPALKQNYQYGKYDPITQTNEKTIIPGSFYFDRSDFVGMQLQVLIKEVVANNAMLSNGLNINRHIREFIYGLIKEHSGSNYPIIVESSIKVGNTKEYDKVLTITITKCELDND